MILLIVGTDVWDTSDNKSLVHPCQFDISYVKSIYAKFETLHTHTYSIHMYKYNTHKHTHSALRCDFCPFFFSTYLDHPFQQVVKQSVPVLEGVVLVERADIHNFGHRVDMDSHQ